MKGQYATFIVRIQDESATNIRGFIQHVRTQEEAHFDSFEDNAGVYAETSDRVILILKKIAKLSQIAEH